MFLERSRKESSVSNEKYPNKLPEISLSERLMLVTLAVLVVVLQFIPGHSHGLLLCLFHCEYFPLFIRLFPSKNAFRFSRTSLSVSRESPATSVPAKFNELDSHNLKHI